jgi:FkbM family methyltransferase
LSWSQFGEDVIMRTYLPEVRGTYVDVGAGHPTHLSNSYFFYRLGWQGTLVEPNPYLARELKRFRGRDDVRQLLLGAELGTSTYYEYESWPLSTIDGERVAQLRQEGLEPLGISKVPMTTLASLGAQALPVQASFLSIDVEGADLGVLEGNDWSVFCPRVISIEEHGVALSGASAVRSFLGLHGYVLVAYAGVTSVFVHEVFLATAG